MATVLITGESSARTARALADAGHMMTGPAEAFTPEQYAQLYDTNVLGTQRVNRKLLPAMRARGDGLVVWVDRIGLPDLLHPTP